MSTPRIFYDFEIFSDQDRGGITRYVLELAERIASHAEVLVYAGIHRSRDLQRRRASWIRGRFFPAFRHSGELRRRINSVLTRRAIAQFQPDLIHRTHYRHAADYGQACPVFCTIHDFIPFAVPHPRHDALIMQQRAREAARRSSHFVFISQSTRADSERFLPESSKPARVIHLGASRLPSPSELRPLDRPYLLFVGQRGGYKNFGTLLRVFAAEDRFADLALLAFGGGPWAQDESRLLRKLRLTDRVYHRSGDDQLLADAYAHALALVYPSRYEGFGLPLVEAMSVGCPVVSSRAASLVEVAGDAAALFDADDSAGMLAAIKDVVLDPAQAQRLRALGRARAAHFTWDACASQTLDFYHAALTSTR